MISCLLQILWILFASVKATKIGNQGINSELAYNKGLSFFFYPDKYYYLKLNWNNSNNQITFKQGDISISIDEQSNNFILHYNNNSTKNHSVKKASFEVSTKKKTFTFNSSDDSLMVNISLNDKTMNITEINKNDENKVNKYYISHQFNNSEEGLFIMQSGLEATNNFNLIALLIVISGVFVSYYGKSWQRISICLYMIYALYILVEDIFEESHFVNDSKEICMFLVIFAIIIGGGLGIFLVKKLVNHFRLFIGFAFGYSLSKAILYLFILPYAKYTKVFHYTYFAISLLLSVVIAIISQCKKFKHTDLILIIAFSCIGSYILMSGLSFYLGGLIFSKIIMTFYQMVDTEKDMSFLKSNNNNIFYLLFYIFNFILSILFNLLSKTYEISKFKLKEEEKDQELSATIIYKSRPSNESEKPNVTQSSGPINLIPHVDQNCVSNAMYQGDNIEEGYENDENKE